MTPAALRARYLDYLACLNARDWPALGGFVHDDIAYNGRSIGVTGYADLLAADVRAIPDLRFVPQIVLAEPPRIACRLNFDCTPVGDLFGLPVNGRRVRFGENVFYDFRDARIASVWSVIDTAAIAGQLSAG